MRFRPVVVDGGKEMLAIETDADTVVSGTLVKGNKVTRTGATAQLATIE
jgi:hypothetical protein